MPGARTDPNRNPEDFWLTKFLRQGTDFNPQPDQDLTQTAGEMAAGFVPVVGQAMAVRDFERARRDDDYLGMGLSAASLVPGGHLLKALRGAKQELIAGRNARHAPQKALNAAEDYANQGLGRQEQWEKTRAYQGPDKQMKWEIDDTPSKLLTKLREGEAEGKLGDILHHPELYANYPDMRNMNVKFSIGPEGGAGSYQPPVMRWMPNAPGLKEGIEASGRGPGGLHQTLLHEIQHAIQAREKGFSTGDNYNKQLKAALKDFKEEYGTLPVEKWEKDRVKRRAYGTYASNMGEAEARAVEKRWVNGLRREVPTNSYDAAAGVDQLWHEGWPRSF